MNSKFFDSLERHYQCLYFVFFLAPERNRGLNDHLDEPVSRSFFGSGIGPHTGCLHVGRKD
jgi:hypothetical protein